MSTTEVKERAELLKAQIDEKRLPRHIAIIMDGNGRWGERHGLSRIEGHKYAVEAIRRVVRTVDDLKIPFLTLFAFSTENVERPSEEVAEIFRLFDETVATEIPELKKRNARVIFSGELEMLPEKICEKFKRAEEETKSNLGLTLNLCVFYSGRSEILRAVEKIIGDIKSEKISPNGIDSVFFSRYFYHPELPDPDLLIRTSGEMRISNFLLWQIAYTELYFTETLWPDFDELELMKAIIEYQSRDRRFGRV